MTKNIFYTNAVYFEKKAEKAIVLSYDVISGVMMMQCICQYAV